MNKKIRKVSGHQMDTFITTDGQEWLHRSQANTHQNDLDLIDLPTKDFTFTSTRIISAASRNEAIEMFQRNKYDFADQAECIED